MAFRELDQVSEVRVVDVPYDGIDTLRGGARWRQLPEAARLGFVGFFPEFLLERSAVLEYPAHECPEAVMLLRIRKLLAAGDDQAIETDVPRLQKKIEALQILRPMPSSGR